MSAADELEAVRLIQLEGDMNNKVHKFKERMDITYEQYYQAVANAWLELAKEFVRVLGKEKAHEAIRDAFARTAPETAKEFCVAYDKEYPLSKFEDFVIGITDLYEYHLEKSTSEMAFTGTVIEASDSHITLEMTECLWADVFKELGETELGFTMCCLGDFDRAQALSHKLKLDMTQTIMQGDECCHQTYRWED